METPTIEKRIEEMLSLASRQSGRQRCEYVERDLAKMPQWYDALHERFGDVKVSYYPSRWGIVSLLTVATDEITLAITGGPCPPPWIGPLEPGEFALWISHVDERLATIVLIREIHSVSITQADAAVSGKTPVLKNASIASCRRVASYLSSIGTLTDLRPTPTEAET